MEQCGTCDYCGEEMPVSQLIKRDNDYYCDNCYTDVVIEKEPEMCPDCNGSGEGMLDGMVCWNCQGKGSV